MKQIFKKQKYLIKIHITIKAHLKTFLETKVMMVLYLHAYRQLSQYAKYFGGNKKCMNFLVHGKELL